MSRIVKIMTLLSALLLPGAAAHGHAFLDHASPLVGSTVATPPRELVLWFTEKLEPAFSSIEVLNAQGHAIPGLYAAGSSGQGGLLLKGHGHHLGWAFTSGKLAGRIAAQQGQSA